MELDDFFVGSIFGGDFRKIFFDRETFVNDFTEGVKALCSIYRVFFFLRSKKG